MEGGNRNSLIKRINETLKANKLMAVLIITVIAFIIVFGAKLLLSLNFFIGNDIIIKLEVDKKDISLVHGEEEEIKFEAKVTKNPFCSASCSSAFIDISKGKIIDKEDVMLSAAAPLQRTYKIKSADFGTGMDLYRFDIECRSSSTLLCHTSEEPSTRSALIAVLNDLNEEEKILKEGLKDQLEDLTGRLGIIQGKLIALKQIYYDFNEPFILKDRINEAGVVFSSVNSSMQRLLEIWETENYYFLEDEADKTEDIVFRAENIFEETGKNLSSYVILYNEIYDKLSLAETELRSMSDMVFTNTARYTEINKTIDEFNNLSSEPIQINDISRKKDIIDSISQKTEELVYELKDEIRKESVKKELENNIFYDSLCEINGVCYIHPSIDGLANISEFNLKEVCSRTEDLRGILSELNESIKEDIINQSYPDTDNFWDNIGLRINNIKQEIISDYLQQIPENKTNTEILKELLSFIPVNKTAEYGEYDLAPALLSKLSAQRPNSCNIVDITFKDVNHLNISRIEVKEQPVSLVFEIKEPIPKCCVFGDCKDCCITDSCRDDPSDFPVVFLHGHAIDKGVSAEYSLEGFNKIQKRLEEDGYLNAGAITLYTGKNAEEGRLGLIGFPATFMASYYFDVFKDPENYVIVQAKSENIDTYSIRVKELVDIVKYKTGRPKVNIVAFSMGGLVARRYIQIFETEDINKLILIGTPNKGIVEKISGICPITGETLECRDMNSESLFINKLNRGSLPDIPVYNIIGTGCTMGDKSGDGVVQEDMAWLDGAYNYVVNGTCASRVNPLHLMLRDIDAYPEVYSIIRMALEEGSS